MICGICGKPMINGEFRMEQRSVDKGFYRAYPVAAFYHNNEKLCETPLDKTTGFYCAECGTLAGFFRYTKPVNFAGRFKADLDSSIDKLPTRNCPECDSEIDIDYPRCPNCGFIFEQK